MSLCNVELYDHNFNYIFNDSIENVDIDEDYFSPSDSRIVLGKIIDIPVNGLIYFDEPYNYLGVITAVDQQDYTTEISFQPFISIFNRPILFNTNYQGNPNGTSLEQVISDIIYRYWKSSRDNDDLQNLEYLRTQVVTNTKNWGFNLKSDTENQHFCIVNMYDVIICNALRKYGVVLSPVVNRTAKTVTIRIETTTESFTVNADLNNVKINSFIVNDLGSVTNKLEIWNSDGYPTNSVIYYYLHPDGSYDTNNTNRIQPVKLSVLSVSPADDEYGDPIPFATLAAEQAASEFGDIEPVNNIELEVLFSDTLVSPMDLRYGQTVLIVHDGNIYNTMLTGRRFSNYVTLIFGVARTDLTKKLKMRDNITNYSDKFINYRSATDTRTGFDTSVIGTKNYSSLTNKPTINGVTIINNQTLSDIGVNTIANSEIDAIVNN